MAEPGRALRYTIVVIRRHGVYELRIPELLLIVKGRSLQDGYERLLERRQEVVDFARSVDALDELPSPMEPPALETIFR